jgi:hypothetical protein
MPEEKEKLEEYQATGGIDLKSSRYVTPDNSFLKISNLDFRTIGALSTTPGTTQYQVPGSTAPITGIVDYWSLGYTAGLRSQTYAIVATTDYGAYNVTGLTYSRIFTGTFIGSTGPVAPYVFSRNQYLFGTNGYDFFTYGVGGTQALQYGLPKPGYLNAPGLVLAGASGQTEAIFFYQAYVRNDGLIGPVVGFTLPQGSLRYNLTMGNILPAYGETLGSFGISGIQLWVQYGSNAPLGLSGLLAPGAGYSLVAGSTGNSFVNFNYNFPFDPEEYFGTFYYGLQEKADNGAFGIQDAGYGAASPYYAAPVLPLAFPNAPSTIEFYFNQLVVGGFVQAPDTVWFSNVGQLEKHDFTNSFDVGAGDGDIVTCIKSYLTNLVIFKTGSVYLAQGVDLQDDVTVSVITNNYGCISPRGACVWNQNLWFLDSNGIASFNGANTEVISKKVDEYFQRMNVVAAKTQAIMLHVKERNEVWCAIPIDGADYNNLLVIYDYQSGGWRTRTLDKATSINNLTQGVNKQYTYQGSYSGILSIYGPSFVRDLGTAFTSTLQTRFHAPLGHSVECQWRRLYLDCTIPEGTTQVYGINFYRNQGNSPVLSTTMVLSDFQNRLEIGIPGRSLSFELIYNGGDFLQFNGYTLEYRLQRLVGSQAKGTT